MIRSTHEGDDRHPLTPGSRTGSDWLDGAHNWIVVYTVGSVVLSTLIGHPIVSTLLHVAAVIPLYYASMRRNLHHLSMSIVIRWGVTLAMTLVCVGVFAPARVASSTLFSDAASETLRSWLMGSGSPPANYAYQLWGMMAFFAGTAVSGGLLGLILLSVAVESSAWGALFLFEHGTNIIPIALTAIPLWQWLLFVSAEVLLVPVAIPVFERLFKPDRVAEGREVLRRYLIVGGGLFLLSLLLRLSLAGTWQTALRHVIVR